MSERHTRIATLVSGIEDRLKDYCPLLKDVDHSQTTSRAAVEKLIERAVTSYSLPCAVVIYGPCSWEDSLGDPGGRLRTHNPGILIICKPSAETDAGSEAQLWPILDQLDDCFRPLTDATVSPARDENTGRPITIDSCWVTISAWTPIDAADYITAGVLNLVAFDPVTERDA